ncbi:MAG: hypothetical protein JWM38_444 [Sphingomonas bacterium]|nr:hypothetical protein [Sphingomonas bacterium]MDB5683665.1 hypothetical protein [Sphingomonas bacterium]MDB5717017.1 hypothetical protein [Sphingomonas bacterium]
MNTKHIAILLGGTLALGACASTQSEPIAPAPPVGPGAIVGTIAADRNGDGIIDGYYTADGIYSAFQAPPCPPPPPPPPPSRSGERG